MLRDRYSVDPFTLYDAVSLGERIHDKHLTDRVSLLRNNLFELTVQTH